MVVLKSFINKVNRSLYVALAGLTGSRTEEVQGRGQRPVRDHLFQKIAQRNNKRLEPGCFLPFRGKSGEEVREVHWSVLPQRKERLEQEGELLR